MIDEETVSLPAQNEGLVSPPVTAAQRATPRLIVIVYRRFYAPGPQGHVDTGGMAGVSVGRGKVHSYGSI